MKKKKPHNISCSNGDKRFEGKTDSHERRSKTYTATHKHAQGCLFLDEKAIDAN